MHVATTLNLESEEAFTHFQEHLVYNVSYENYLFELERMDWYKSEREISEKLVTLLSSEWSISESAVGG